MADSMGSLVNHPHRSGEVRAPAASEPTESSPRAPLLAPPRPAGEARMLRGCWTARLLLLSQMAAQGPLQDSFTSQTWAAGLLHFGDSRLTQGLLALLLRGATVTTSSEEGELRTLDLASSPRLALTLAFILLKRSREVPSTRAKLVYSVLSALLETCHADEIEGVGGGWTGGRGRGGRGADAAKLAGQLAGPKAVLERFFELEDEGEGGEAEAAEDEGSWKPWLRLFLCIADLARGRCVECSTLWAWELEDGLRSVEFSDPLADGGQAMESMETQAMQATVICCPLANWLMQNCPTFTAASSEGPDVEAAEPEHRNSGSSFLAVEPESFLEVLSHGTQWEVGEDPTPQQLGQTEWWPTMEAQKPEAIPMLLLAIMATQRPWALAEQGLQKSNLEASSKSFQGQAEILAKDIDQSKRQVLELRSSLAGRKAVLEEKEKSLKMEETVRVEKEMVQREQLSAELDQTRTSLAEAKAVLEVSKRRFDEVEEKGRETTKRLEMVREELHGLRTEDGESPVRSTVEDAKAILAQKTAKLNQQTLQVEKLEKAGVFGKFGI
eukprot:s2621_g6.t1